VPLQDLEKRSKEIETLKLTFTVEYSSGAKSGVLDEYRETKGYLFVQRPDHIRVQVQMPIVLTTVNTVPTGNGLVPRAVSTKCASGLIATVVAEIWSACTWTVSTLQR